MNMPLNDVVAQGLPSCYVEFGWSLNNMSNNAGNMLLNDNNTEVSVMCDRDKDPQWNQQILFHNPKNVLDFKSGFFVMQIKDHYRDEIIDQLNIPMNLFKPFNPIHMEVNAPHRENPSEKY
jgi:hypothetical protein